MEDETIGLYRQIYELRTEKDILKSENEIIKLKQEEQSFPKIKIGEDVYEIIEDTKTVHDFRDLDFIGYGRRQLTIRDEIVGVYNGDARGSTIYHTTRLDNAAFGLPQLFLLLQYKEQLPKHENVRKIIFTGTVLKSRHGLYFPTLYFGAGWSITLSNIKNVFKLRECKFPRFKFKIQNDIKYVEKLYESEKKY